MIASASSEARNTAARATSAGTSFTAGAPGRCRLLAPRHALVHLGGADRRDGDAVRPELLRERAREAHHGELRGALRHEVLEAHLPVDRRQVDDASAPARLHRPAAPRACSGRRRSRWCRASAPTPRRVNSSRGFSIQTPALFTSTSMRPKRACARAYAASTSVFERTSARAPVHARHRAPSETWRPPRARPRCARSGTGGAGLGVGERDRAAEPAPRARDPGDCVRRASALIAAPRSAAGRPRALRSAAGRRPRCCEQRPQLLGAPDRATGEEQHVHVEERGDAARRALARGAARGRPRRRRGRSTPQRAPSSSTAPHVVEPHQHPREEHAVEAPRRSGRAGLGRKSPGARLDAWIELRASPPRSPAADRRAPPRRPDARATIARAKFPRPPPRSSTRAWAGSASAAASSHASSRLVSAIARARFGKKRASTSGRVKKGSPLRSASGAPARERSPRAASRGRCARDRAARCGGASARPSR